MNYELLMSLLQIREAEDEGEGDAPGVKQDDAGSTGGACVIFGQTDTPDEPS